MAGEQAATTTPSRSMLGDGLADQLLARVGAHVLVVGGEGDVRVLGAVARPRCATSIVPAMLCPQ